MTPTAEFAKEVRGSLFARLFGCLGLANQPRDGSGAGGLLGRGASTKSLRERARYAFDERSGKEGKHFAVL